jgi:hypothetical protein
MSPAGVAWQDLAHDFWATFRPGGYRARGAVTIGRWAAQTLRARTGPFADWRDPMPGLVRLGHLSRKLIPGPRHRR